MQLDENEEKLLRSVALQNAKAVLLARERAERELVRANQSITNILESITDGFFALDKEWRFIFINGRAEEILRPLIEPRESLLGVSHWEVFPDTVATPLEQHYRRAMREQVTVQFETFYAPLKAWFDIRAYPSPDGLSIYFQDITQHKRAADELREQREWFAVTLGSIGDAVIATDVDGRITFLNAVAEAMTGWKSNEAAGQPLEHVFRIINEQTREPAVSPVSKVLRERKTVALANHTALVARDGRLTSIEDSAAPIKDLAGNISGVVLVFHDVTERRRVDEAVRESEKRFAALVSASAETVWVADATGEFAQYSPSWNAFTGQTFEEMKGWGRLKAIHPDDRERLEALWKQAIVTKTVVTTDYQLRHVSGEWRWTTLRAVPLLAADGSVNSWVGMNTDVTERKRAEESLRESENRKSAILSAALDAIISMDHEGNVVDFNPAAESIFGYARAEVIGKQLAEMIIPERFRQQHYDGLKHYLATGKGPVLNKRIEIPALRADGSEFPTELSISPIAGLDPPMFTATLRDITERKRSEEALRESEERFRAIVQATPECVNVVDRDGTLLSINSAGCGMMEAAGDVDVVGRSFYPAIAAEFRDRFMEFNQSVCQGNKGRLEFQIVGLKGTQRWMETHAVPMRDPATGQTVQLAVTRDVTAQKQSEEKLRQAQEQLSHHAEELEKQVALRTASLREAIAQLEEFSYSLSHDLRAPLRAIAGYTQIFSTDYAAGLPAEALSFLYKISRSTERMERLVNDVLAMSRVARVEMKLHPIALQGFIEEIVEQHPEMQPPAANVSITAPHIVIADDASLDQAISNLLVNAVKFVPDGIKPAVKVRSQPNGERIRIWVEDNGIGIKAEQRSKLFGMFQRLPTSLHYEGTGIGLAIVRRAVERMGGTVGIESNGTTGSQFWVELQGHQ